MSSKPNTACKTIAKKDTKNIVQACRRSSVKDGESTSYNITSEQLPEKLASYENCSTLIEVTVKTKGHKRASTMVSSSPRNHGVTEEKKKSIGHTETCQNWGQILREGNRAAIKQGLQEPTTRMTKMGRQRCEEKEYKDMRGHKENKIVDASKKQSSVLRKSEGSTKSAAGAGNSSATATANHAESILVVDRAVQCDGICGHGENKFSGTKPARTLSFLLKELKHSVAGDKARKILCEMEQVLLKVPTTNALMQDLESVTLRTKLETCTKQLEETSKEMNMVCGSLREERDVLERQIHKQVLRESHLEAVIKSLQGELEDMKKTMQNREKIIMNLKDEMKGHEYSQKVIEDLRASLNEQSELARQKNLEVQYLTLEKDKLSVLSSYKDTLLVELRKNIKDLQNHITGQLAGLKSSYTNDETNEPQISLVQGGLACSSPTLTSSRESPYWRDTSDMSFSIVDHHSDKGQVQEFYRELEKIAEPSKKADNEERKTINKNKESKAKDSMHLEFISLPGGETSSVLPSYGDTSCPKSAQPTKGNEDCRAYDQKDNTAQQSINTEAVCFSGNCPVKANKRIPNAQKSSYSSEKKNCDDRFTGFEDSSQVLKTKLVASSITQQFQNIFDGIRYQSRMPVELPSPPRNYPQPDLSHSTLPNISAMSELNGVHSNDT